MTFNVMVHRNILVSILKDIYSDVTLSTILGLKDGTAVYLFYELPRTSVDLDFDLLDIAQETYVLETLTKILASYGIVKEARKKRYSKS